MNCDQRISKRHRAIAILTTVLALSGVGGCGGESDDAMPVAADAGKRDAKRDTLAGTGGGPGATGGALGGLDALGAGGAGGAGGASVIVGTGGSAGTIDAGRDAGPDLADGPRPVDVGPETTVGMDSGRAEVPREVGGDGPAVDTTGQVDLPIDTRSDAPDSPADTPPVIPTDTRDTPTDTLDGPTDTSDGPTDTPDSPETADRPDTIDVNEVVPPPPLGCSNPSWAKSWSLQTAGWMAGDKDGNLFVANAAYHNLTLGGTAAPIVNAGDSDAIVVRFDPSTGSPVWAKGFGDGSAQIATRVAVDKSGRVGFIGDYMGAMTIGSSNLSNLGLWPNGYVGALQAADGAPLWAISVNLQAASGSTGAFNAIAAHPNFDDFVVCGKANVAATELKAGLTLGGDYDIIVAKIKGNDGSVLWARQIGGAGNQLCSAAAIDDSGNVLLTGTYSGTLDFGSGPFSTAPTGANQLLWVAKLSGTDGTTVAAIAPTPSGTATMSSVVPFIDADSSGNVVIAGGFRGALTFGSLPTVTSAGNYDALVVKLGSTLAPIWAQRWGDAKAQRAEAAAFDSSGNVTVVGHFIGTMDIGPGGEVLTAASDSTSAVEDIFLARLSGSTGAPSCALRYGDISGQQAFNLVIPRWSTSANKDTTFVSGLQNQGSLLNFGSVTLDTTGLSEPAALWTARF